jgi:multiple sugar transport system permease protein
MPERSAVNPLTDPAPRSTLIRAPRALLSDHPLPWLLPLIAILVALAVYPFFYNIWLSFHEFVPRRRGLDIVGLANWQTLWSGTRVCGAHSA